MNNNNWKKGWTNRSVITRSFNDSVTTSFCMCWWDYGENDPSHPEDIYASATYNGLNKIKYYMHSIKGDGNYYWRYRSSTTKIAYSEGSWDHYKKSDFCGNASDVRDQHWEFPAFNGAIGLKYCFNNK